MKTLAKIGIVISVLLTFTFIQLAILPLDSTGKFLVEAYLFGVLTLLCFYGASE